MFVLFFAFPCMFCFEGLPFLFVTLSAFETEFFWSAKIKYKTLGKVLNKVLDKTT